MRHLRLLALVAPALLFPIIACEDSSGTSGGVFNPEAGPGFEAGPTPDAGPLPDGAVPDTSPVLGVTVTVFDVSTPKKDVRVIFHDASGLVTGQALTDIAGKVTVAIAPSMVTVLQKDASQRPANVSFAGVADGDNLKVVNGGLNGPVGAYSVTFTGGAVIANASNFFVQAGNGCFGGTDAVDGTANVPLFSDCIGPNDSVLATASNGGPVLGFGFAKNVPAPIAAATVPVGPLAFTASGTTNVKATNLPSAAGVSSGATLSAISGGQGFGLSYYTGTVGGAGLDFATPTGFADAYQTAVKATDVSINYAETALVRREATTAPASATLAAFDFSTALPFITNVTASQAVPARPDITMTSANAAALATSDAAVVKISWFASLDTSGSWTVMVPPSTTSFKFPALPADATAFEPLAAGFAVETVTFFDASQLPNYGAAKLLPIQPTFGVDFALSTRILPAAGTLRVSTILPNAG
jgi:hypothetical protein